MTKDEFNSGFVFQPHLVSIFDFHVLVATPGYSGVKIEGLVNKMIPSEEFNDKTLREIYTSELMSWINSLIFANTNIIWVNDSLTVNKKVVATVYPMGNVIGMGNGAIWYSLYIEGKKFGKFESKILARSAAREFIIDWATKLRSIHITINGDLNYTE
jgi:hypothetical protein